jgi:starch phosphorylase
MEDAYEKRRRLPAARPAADYTARVSPSSDDLSVPLEDAPILWQR